MQALCTEGVMTIDEKLRQHFQKKYEQLSTLDYKLHGYGSSYFISIFIGVILLPAIHFSGDPDYYFLVPLWFMWGWSTFTTLKDIPRKNSLLSELREMESNLQQFSKLRFCDCGRFNAHFFSPETEQLYNIKSDVLFEKHSITNYEVWHSRFKPEPKWRKNLYILTSVSFFFINVALIIWVYGS
jgi:hypothetical protein